ncbi:MAG: Sugar phosphatase YidA [Tenericutes bacterium ADurb.BinA155]|nr:MAG: Sugar phosphatase YidA [Tenericutes bacterium ADurb.BinA155]
MNIKKLIAIDLDGTLLSDDSRLLPLTESYLASLNEQGYLIVLASGRPWRSMEEFYRRLHCQGPAICYNGAFTFDPNDPSFTPRVFSFPENAIKDIYNKLQGKVTSFMCESNSEVYINRRDSYLDHFFWYTGMKVNLGDIEKILNCDPMTCIMKNVHRYDSFVQDVLAPYKEQGINLHHWTASLYSELACEGATKGDALASVIEHYGLKKEDVIAFGDADNDGGMLALAAKAYCMKNCKSAALKARYPQTKKGNNQNGVALMLADLL